MGKDVQIDSAENGRIDGLIIVFSDGTEGAHAAIAANAEFAHDLAAGGLE
jgi:hypothetical protein